jgi:ADP-heptose:LPS heptosyltransferase
MMKSFLIIQTAFTGDAILLLSLAEKLHRSDKDYLIDILVRRGNESLFTNHPFIGEVLIWDKKKNKYRNLFKIINVVRRKRYDVVINLQRFAGTGLLTAFSAAKIKIGFNKNPLSFLFNKRIKHIVGNGKHEIERNQEMINDFTDGIAVRPRLYPSTDDYDIVQPLKGKPYLTIAPVSMWFTKTFPAYKWIDLVKFYEENKPGVQWYLLGSKEEYSLAEVIIEKSGVKNIRNLCGSLTFLQSAALMKDAEMNFTNDSAPLHLCGAMNAPVTVVYCSTVPDFGFGPLSDRSKIIETKINLDCRPCGLHGYSKCPLTHFKCAHSILINENFLA